MHLPSTAARQPALNVPLSLLVWIGLLAAIHLGRQFLSEEADLRLIIETAFLPAPWSIAAGVATPADVVAAAETGGVDAGLRLALARFVVTEPLRPWSALTYSFLHGSWMHLGVNALWFLAFGALVLRRVGTARAAVLWAVTAAGGAFAQWLGDPRAVDVVIGASASVSGFMAAAATFMYGPGEGGRWAFLRNRNVLVFLGVWLFANVVFALVAGPMGLSDGDVAWKAHIGGLVAALALFPFLDRPEPRFGWPPAA